MKKKFYVIFKNSKIINVIIITANILALVVLILVNYYDRRILSDIQSERMEYAIRADMSLIQSSLDDMQYKVDEYLISGKQESVDEYKISKQKLLEISNNLLNKISFSKEENKRPKVIFDDNLIKETVNKFDDLIKLKHNGSNQGIGFAGNSFKNISADSLQKVISYIINAEYDSLMSRIQDSEHSLAIEENLSLAGSLIIIFIVGFISLALKKDVVKREKITHELKETEKYFKFLFDLTKDGLLVTDYNGTIINCNNAIIKMFGYKKDELINNHYQTLFFNKELTTSDKFDIPKDYLRIESSSNENIAFQKNKNIIYIEHNSSKIEIAGEKLIVTFIRDITEKKKSQEELFRNKEWFKQLYEKSQSAIFKSTLDGKILDCNLVYANLLGYNSVEEIITVNTKNFYWNPEDRKKFIDILKVNGEVHDYQLKLKKKDGTFLWALENIALLYDNVLEQRLLFGSFADITIQKESTILLEKSEKKYRDLAELLPQTVFELDDKGKVVFVNKNGLEMFGYSRNDLVKTFYAAQLFVAESRDKLFNRLSKALLGAKLSFTEYCAIKKDGTTFPCLVFSEQIYQGKDETSTKQITGIRGILIDISEQKKYREQNNLLANVLKSITELVSVTDLDNNIIFVNDAFLKEYGYEQEGLIGQNINIVVTSNEIQNSPPNVMQETMAGNWQGELLNKRKDGTVFPIYLSTTLVKDEDGNLVAAVGVAKNITEEKRMLSEIIQAKEKAENANRLKSEFLAQISHEIRTPLVGIIGYTDLIRSEYELGEVKDLSNYLDAIIQSGKRIQRTMELILLTSQTIANSYQYRPEELNLFDEILFPLYQEFKPIALSKKIEFNIINNTENQILLLDKYSLEQIFENLIDNAIKYTENGKVDIEISNQNGRLVVNIIDTGIGISEEFQQQVYEPFRQEEQGYSRAYEGVGLGLTLVKNLCDINHITITIKSKKGSGSIFTLIF
jgi:PAS domain S-box-containing protein